MLVYFMDTWSISQVFCYILWTFGIVRGNLVHFPPFWYFVPRKIWQPWGEERERFIISVVWEKQQAADETQDRSHYADTITGCVRQQQKIAD
jgi:hypothetical protein